MAVPPLGAATSPWGQVNRGGEGFMDPAYVPALAALAGSAIGGLTSFATTWLTQQTKVRAQQLVDEIVRREELYKDFIEEASRLYADGRAAAGRAHGR